MSYEEYLRIRAELTAEQIDADPSISAMLDLIEGSVPQWEKPRYLWEVEYPEPNMGEPIEEMCNDSFPW